jgi:uncharacterized membrane protein
VKVVTLKKIIKGREYSVLALVSLGFIIMLVIMYFSSGGEVGGFFHNSIISAIVEILSVLVTVLLLTELLNMRQKRINKKNAYEVIKVNYSLMLLNAFRLLHLIITKEGYKEQKSSGIHENLIMVERINEIKENLVNYVNEDFYKKNPIRKVLNPMSSNIFEGIEDREVEMSDLLFEFKKNTREDLDRFLMKYSIVLPDDLRDKLYTLDNFIIKTPLFITPNEYGHPQSFKNMVFDPELVRNHINEILEILSDLLIYFEEYEEVIDTNNDQE